MYEGFDSNMRDTGFESSRELAAKWLHFLFYTQIAGLAVSVLTNLPGLYTVCSWVSRIVSVCTIVALFQLAPANARYRKAAIFMCVPLIYGLISVALVQYIARTGADSSLGTVFTLIASVCSLIGVYQEYAAHSDMVADRDPALSRKWRSLFIWKIVAGVAASFGSLMLTFAVVMLGISRLVTVITVVIRAVGIILQVIYLMYLNRTMRFFWE